MMKNLIYSKVMLYEYEGERTDLGCPSLLFKWNVCGHKWLPGRYPINIRSRTSSWMVCEHGISMRGQAAASPATQFRGTARRL